VFNNVDSVGDRIVPGFFKESLQRLTPKGVWMHNWDKPIAKTLEARELPPYDPLLPDELKSLGGLYVKGWINQETQLGREAFSNIKNGIIDEFSIGFTVADEVVGSDGVRELRSGTLYEWSPVLFGANNMTALIGAKGHPALRAGFNDEGEAVEDAVRAFGVRVKERNEIRLKEGRTFSNANVARLSSFADTMEQTAKDIRGMIDTATAKSGITPEQRRALTIQHLQSIGVI
jgi:HK97 family phage prohead protease